MRFHASFTLATLAASSSASPLVRRQGGGSGISANATEVNDKHGKITYPVIPETFNGSSYDVPVFVSVPEGYGKKWDKNNEPYPGAAQLVNPATKNGTNTTLAAPYTPAGGVDGPPTYHPESNFDFQSLNLGMNQELIELDLFHNGLAKFSIAEFEAAGITADDRFLIEHMADQEVGHAILISNMLGVDRSAKTCVYQYPYTTVKEFILFCQVLTRWGEAGVYGFLPHLNSRSAAQMLLQSITVEARQQMAFRQLQGLPAQPEWFETGLSQSYAWTMLSRFIKSCPSTNPRIEWQNFPALTITNQPWALAGKPGINSNYTLTSGAGRKLHFTWEQPGKVTGYDDLYVTSTFAGEPKFLAFFDQLNVTYAPIYDVKKGHDGLSSASARVPASIVFRPEPQVVNTVFVSLVDKDLPVSPYTISLLNNATVAGPTWFFAS
ncbi:hypothetical protein JCM21900_002411 [Sporobolomyces salmonicolor]